MLPFFFIPNKNTLFLLYTMLQTTYKDNKYIFYVTLKDAEQYDAFGKFPVPIVGDRYLFKFTNDMSGAVKWAYSNLVTINDRYAKLEVFNTVLQDENIYEGRVNFEPNGYWKYEIYWMYSGTDVPSSNCDLFNPLETGTWECTNSSGVVIDSGNLDVDVYEIIDLPEDTYTIKEYSTCNPPPFTQVSSSVNTLTQIIQKFNCPKERLLRFTNVVRKSQSTEFHITSRADEGYEIRFVGNEWTGRTYSYIIKTNPENIIMDISSDVDGLPYDEAYPYSVSLFNGAALVQDYSNDGGAGGSAFKAIKKPSSQRLGSIMAWNNEWESACAGGDSGGSIFFTWNNTGNSPNGGFITNYEAPIEIGKLLVEEPFGDEQVKYKQHESPSDTNYIYND